MNIPPYIDELLKSWGRDVRRIKPWYSETPYLKEHIGKTTRTLILDDQADDVERIGECIGGMAEPLRRALEATYKHQLRTLHFKAKWCRCTKGEYKALFCQAIKKLEDFLSD